MYTYLHIMSGLNSINICKSPKYWAVDNINHSNNLSEKDGDIPLIFINLVIINNYNKHVCIQNVKTNFIGLFHGTERWFWIGYWLIYYTYHGETYLRLKWFYSKCSLSSQSECSFLIFEQSNGKTGVLLMHCYLNCIKLYVCVSIFQSM